MDVILNYAVLRPVVPDGASRSTLSSDSDFQRQLAAAAASAEPLAGATTAAQAFVRSGFLRRPEEVPHGPSLIALVARLRSGPLPGPEELLSAVRAALGDASPESFAGDLARAQDSVVAAYLLPDAPSADTAADLVRIYSLARALLAGSPTGDDLEAMLRGPMALPEAVTRLRPAGSGATAASPVVSVRDLVDRINSLTERQQRLAGTLEAVSLHAEDELLLSELGEQTPLSSLYRVAAVRERIGPGSPRAAASTVGKPPMTAGGGEDLTSPLLRAGTRHNVVLSARAVALLPARALETVRGLDLDPASAPLAEMQGRLQADVRAECPAANGTVEHVRRAEVRGRHRPEPPLPGSVLEPGPRGRAGPAGARHFHAADHARQRQAPRRGGPPAGAGPHRPLRAVGGRGDRERGGPREAHSHRAAPRHVRDHHDGGDRVAPICARRRRRSPRASRATRRCRPSGRAWDRWRRKGRAASRRR